MALLRIPCRVEYEDGQTADVVVDQRDAARWEAAHPDMPFQDAMERQPNATFRYLAWTQQRRTKATELPYDDWADTVLEALPLDAYTAAEDAELEADAVDPGQPTARAGGS
jgi:hypothetical protein